MILFAMSVLRVALILFVGFPEMHSKKSLKIFKHTLPYCSHEKQIVIK